MPWVIDPLPVYSMMRSPILDDRIVFSALISAGLTEPLRKMASVAVDLQGAYAFDDQVAVQLPSDDVYRHARVQPRAAR
jgi:hypothetical protein